jgi:glycosyltransferase involved in cell wall biosynthesis
VIPVICAKYPLAHFIIGGDGPKKLLLEEMKERTLLHDRVELLGEVPHGRVRDVSPSPSSQHLLSIYTHNIQHTTYNIQLSIHHIHDYLHTFNINTTSYTFNINTTFTKIKINA